MIAMARWRAACTTRDKRLPGTGQRIDICEILWSTERPLVGEQALAPEYRYGDASDRDDDAGCPGSLELDTCNTGHEINTPGRKPDLDHHAGFYEMLKLNAQRLNRGTKSRQRLPDAGGIRLISVNPDVEIAGCAGDAVTRESVRPTMRNRAPTVCSARSMSRKSSFNPLAPPVLRRAASVGLACWRVNNPAGSAPSSPRHRVQAATSWLSLLPEKGVRSRCQGPTGEL